MDDSNDDFLAFTSSSMGNYEDPTLLTSLDCGWFHGINSRYTEIIAPFASLHNEILNFCEYIAPTKDELLRRDAVLNDIKKIAKRLWPNATMHIFGSQMTRILTPSSDIDIVFLDVPEVIGESLVDRLYDLADAVNAAGLVSYVEVISSAKVPIIKLDHKVTGIAVDICINNRSGLETGQLIRTFVHEYPPMRPLTIVLKVFLGQRRLNDTYSGGVGSFMLCCMIISFLQMRRRLECTRSFKFSWNLGVLLLDFFSLYGNSFNYMHTGISVKDGGAYFRKREREGDWGNISRPGLLALENPETPNLDIGRNSFMLAKIRRSFEHASQVLMAALSSTMTSCDTQRIESPKSYLSFIIRPDDPALRGRGIWNMEGLSNGRIICEAKDLESKDAIELEEEYEGEYIYSEKHARRHTRDVAAVIDLLSPAKRKRHASQEDLGSQSSGDEDVLDEQQLEMDQKPSKPRRKRKKHISTEGDGRSPICLGDVEDLDRVEREDLTNQGQSAEEILLSRTTKKSKVRRRQKKTINNATGSLPNIQSD